VDLGAVGWMVGADPKFQKMIVRDRVLFPDIRLMPAPSVGLDRDRFDFFCPLSFVLVQMRPGARAGIGGRNFASRAGDSFETGSETAIQRSLPNASESWFAGR